MPGYRQIHESLPESRCSGRWAVSEEVFELTKGALNLLELFVRPHYLGSGELVFAYVRLKEKLPIQIRLLLPDLGVDIEYELLTLDFGIKVSVHVELFDYFADPVVQIQCFKLSSLELFLQLLGFGSDLGVVLLALCLLFLGHWKSMVYSPWAL